MMLPGSNLLLVGGLFLAGWFSGRNGFNRNEDDYVSRTNATELGRGGDHALPAEEAPAGEGEPLTAPAQDEHAAEGKKDA
jgi:hypothetical protein